VLAPQGFLDLDDRKLDYRFVAGRFAAAPMIVMLHEGLGSAALWGAFPDRLAEATGCAIFVYSRAGYGASSPVPLPRPLTYMHDEALQVLPRLLDAIGFERGALLGHSDGGSIAAIFAGGVPDLRVEAISLFAPHFFTEDFGLQEIARAKELYEAGDLKPRLARWHKNVDVSFYGWNGAWLDPGFRQWTITEYLPRMRCAVQILQGEKDPYGSMRQADVLVEHYPATEVVALPNVGHSPHREAADATLAAAADFFRRALRLAPAGATDSVKKS
jgi:pimeloyl-ACP methyl ester carboxylesterase